MSLCSLSLGGSPRHSSCDPCRTSHAWKVLILQDCPGGPFWIPWIPGAEQRDISSAARHTQLAIKAVALRPWHVAF